MKKKVAILACLIFGVLFNPAAKSEASLILSADPSIYIAGDANPWFTDSYLTGPASNFTLRVENSFQNNDIEGIYLVIALKSSTKDGLKISIEGNDLDGSYFTASGAPHPFMQDSHGVYGDDTFFYDFEIGDLSAQSWLDLNVNIVTNGLPIVHFDAYGYKVKNVGGLQLVNNPNSHDVTWDPPEYNERVPPVPEPATLSLLGLGLFGLAGLKRKRA